MCLNSVYKKTRVCTKKTSNLRLAKRQKAEYTGVNEHFCRKRNEEIFVFLQTLFIIFFFQNLSIAQLKTVSCSPDQICAGQSSTLIASGGAFYDWSPSTGLNTTSGSIVIATPNTTTTYAVTYQSQASNLIVNGDFSAGNTGFSSSYTYKTPPNTSPGQYYVSTNANLWNTSMQNCGDHTTGTGNFMMVNGLSVANTSVYCQTVNVTPNTNYALSAWLVTLYNLNYARLQFSINGVLIGNILNAAGYPCIWREFHVVWNSGSNTTATICIVNQNIAAMGNDFGIDDIFFAEVNTLTDSCTVIVNPLPGNITLSGGGTFCGGTSATINASGGTGGTIYWQGASSNGTSTASATTSCTISTSGTYYFRSRSAAGCWGTQGSAIVYVGIPGTVAVSGGGSACGSKTLTAEGGTGGTIYWQGTTSGGSYTSTPSTYQVVTASGTYYFRPYNNCGWGAEGSAVVTINTLPSFVMISGGGTICGGSTTLTAYGGTGGTIYWQGTSSNGTSTASATTSCTISTSGTYYFRSRSAAGCWGTQGSAVVYFISTLPGTVSVSGGGTACGSGTLTASGGTGGTIYWQGISSGATSTTLPSTSYSVTSSGTYYCRAYNECGWGTEGSAVIAIKPVPSAVIVSNDGIPCSGCSITLTASGGTGGTIYWQGTSSNGTSTAIASTTQTVSNSGIYYFRSFNQECWGPQGSIAIPDNSILDVNITTNYGEDIILPCNQNCVTLNAMASPLGESNTYSVSAIPFVSQYSFSTGTIVLVNIDDRWSGVINLPFNFCFYGNSYNKVIVGSNGVVSFNIFDAYGMCFWQFADICPSPNLITNAIFGPYHDIDPTKGGTILYSTLGTYPNRVFVINWNQIPLFSGENNCDTMLATHQIILHETSNIIDINIQNSPSCDSWNNGNGLVGIQDSSGLHGLAAPGRNTGPWSAQNEAWRYTPTGSSIVHIDWYDENHFLGSGDSMQVCPSASTTYTAEATYNTCSGVPVLMVDTIRITRPTNSVNFAPVNPSVCFGDSVNITASGSDSYAWLPVTGLNHAAGADIQASPATTTTYTVIGTSQGCADTNTITVTVKPIPTAKAGHDTVCSGSPVPIGDPSNGPGTITWSPASGLNNTTIAQPLASPTVTTTYTLTVINNGCLATDEVVITVYPLHTIYGKTKYKGRAYNGNPAPNPPSYNSPIYNIDRVMVILKSYPSGVEVARDTSDESGNYLLADISDGEYLVSWDKYTLDTMQWGNDITVTDVSMMKFFIACDTLQDPSRKYTADYKKAADVDNNATINVIDVARIKSKIASPYNAVKNFPKGNWVRFEKALTMAGSDVNMNLETICYGDYNASSSKYRDSATTWNGLKSLQPEIIVVSDEYITTADPDYVEIPLRISTKMNEFSALGLELSYPANEFKLVNVSIPGTNNKTDAIKFNPSIDEIIADDNDLLVTDENGVIRIEYATTKYFDIAANEQIINLGFRSLRSTGPGELKFKLNGTGVIADQYGEENEDAYLIMPKVFVQSNQTEAGFDFTAYPNPFDNDVTINYTIPEKGIVNLKIYNTLGKLIKELVHEEQKGGKHSVNYTQGNLPAGLYTFKLEFSGINKSKCMVLKLVQSKN